MPHRFRQRGAAAQWGLIRPKTSHFPCPIQPPESTSAPQRTQQTRQAGGAPFRGATRSWRCRFEQSELRLRLSQPLPNLSSKVH
jgi:hypothetical protein